MVEKWSFLYWIVRPYFYFSFWLFHRKIVIIGKENIPLKKPVIYAPNHPNALHDDLSIVYSVPHQVVWLGRADMFKSRIALPFLKFLKIIPVYRIRDGKESLSANDETFKKAIRVLQNNHAIGLYPEGDNSTNRKMKPHKKAIPRIVFLGGELSDFTLDVNIIPTGIYFDQNHNFGRRLLIQFGQPLEAKNYFGPYRENPFKATLSLRNDLHQAVLPLTLNYNRTEFVEGYEAIRTICSRSIIQKQGLKETFYNQFITGRKLAGKLEQWETEEPDKATELAQKALNFINRLPPLGLRNWLVDKKEENPWKLFLHALFLLLTLPWSVFGFLFSAIPFFGIDTLVRKKVKQEFFKGTFSFGLGFLLFPIVYVIEMILVSPLLPGWYWKLLFLISLPLTGKFAHLWYLLFLKIRGRLRWLKIKRSNPELYGELHRTKQEIIVQVESLS
jgi:1-acyl-sn-glycerol-3-phosphate acyltransferase